MPRVKTTPYDALPTSAFWNTGVVRENPYLIKDIYKKKFFLSPDENIATAGSCFAQHISRHLRTNNYKVMDVEPPPPGLPETLHQQFGYSMYSARYGNIYTVRQLLQLAQEVLGEWEPKNFIWKKNDKYVDALRPAVEPEGLDTPDEVVEHRQYHIDRVRELFQSLDVFIFTLGLTEMWVHRPSGTVYPTAPGTIAGEYDDTEYQFENASSRSVHDDFGSFLVAMEKIRSKPFKMILTVSPVPLTATASGHHVLLSTTYSKSVLRAAAGEWSTLPFIDYFPSYEIVTNPRLHSTAFTDSLRSVRDEAVSTVMRHFFAEHPALSPPDEVPLTPKEDGRGKQKGHEQKSRKLKQSAEDVQCEEALLEAFQK